MFHIRQELDFTGMFLIRQEKDVGDNASKTDSIAKCTAVIVQKKENFKTHARACKERGNLKQERGITSIIASRLCSKLKFQQDHMMCQLMTLFNSMKLADQVLYFNFKFQQDEEKNAYEFKGRLHMCKITKFWQKVNMLDFKGMFYIRQEKAVHF